MTAIVHLAVCLVQRCAKTLASAMARKDKSLALERVNKGRNGQLTFSQRLAMGSEARAEEVDMASAARQKRSEGLNAVEELERWGAGEMASQHDRRT